MKSLRSAWCITTNGALCGLWIGVNCIDRRNCPVEIVMTKENPVCRLCGQVKPLENSHIIPRSFYKRIKKGTGQLLVIKEYKEPKLSNSDPKEKLLCFDCEQYLSKNYESYGTSIMRKSDNVIHNKECIYINNFRYKTFYIFYLSILWRASISNHPSFSAVSLDSSLERLIAECIIADKIKIGAGSSMRLDHFFRLSIVRLVDVTNNIADSVIRSVISSFRIVKAENATVRAIIYYIILDGFLVTYVLTAGKDIHSARANRIKSQLLPGSSIKIDKVDIGTLKEVRDMFNLLIDKSKSRT